MTYEQRLERDIERIREQIRSISRDIEQALKDSVHALLTGDRRLSYWTILGDARINQACQDLHQASHRFVARHLPSAGHLRFVSTVMRLSDELERIGDYAATICRESVQLREKPAVSILRDIDLMADQTFAMFRQAVRSFDENNAELARGVGGMAAQISRTFERVFEDLVSESGKGSRQIEDLFAMMAIFNRLTRVAGRSKNICESTIFYATGANKSAKHHKILFVDAANARASQLAEAIARKAFPELGVYRSCGWAPADRIEEDLIGFLDKNGLPISRPVPDPLPPLEELAEYHVIVTLEPGLDAFVPRIPFHSILLEWHLAELLPLDEPSLGEIHQILAGKIEELVVCLWGQSE